MPVALRGCASLCVLLRRNGLSVRLAHGRAEREEELQWQAGEVHRQLQGAHLRRFISNRDLTHGDLF